MKKTITLAVQTGMLIALVSCASSPSETTGDSVDTAPAAGQSSVSATVTTPTDPGTAQASPPVTSTMADEKDEDPVVLGTGVFVQNAGTGEGNVYAGDNGVTLNFQQANLTEFLSVVFDRILQENYLVDPQVNGTVTVRTTRPVTAEAVMPIVEAVLEQNGAAVIRDKGVFRIVPLADAVSSARSPSVGRFPSSNKGYGVHVVPLQHVSATELEKIIGPYIPSGSSLRVDPTRNILILSGPKYRLDELLSTIRTFDVDWLKGMSFAMFKLEYADAQTVVTEIEALLKGEGGSPLAGIVRLLPIERLNAVLMITHRPEHVASVQKLLVEFDRGLQGTSGRRLFVYPLENGKAESIASVLQQIYGQRPLDDSDEDPFRSTGAAGSVFRTAESISRPPPNPGQPTPITYRPAPTVTAAGRQTTGDDGEGIDAENQGEVTIIADRDNNSIIIMSTPQDYRSIEATIRRLDTAPRQVLIEATIAEVTLSNTLSYGVRWFVENADWQLGYRAPVPSQASGDGLAFAFFDEASDVKLFFDVLATESDVKFLSTPQVMVLDNQTANIRVGDQIPVTTRSSQSTTNPDAPIVTEVQFRDTGTLLTVTPRINASGQITLDISQEVSLPGTEPAVGGGGNVSIAQRTINSSVIVQSGQTVVLGGLILETETQGKSGVPGLMNVPVIGKLFSTTSTDTFRTELIVTVSPRVIEDPLEMERVTDEMRSRISTAYEYEQEVKNAAGSTRR